jgi:hypothetical protein
LIFCAMGSSDGRNLRSPNDGRMSSYAGCALVGSGPFPEAARSLRDKLGKTPALTALSSKRNPPLLMISWTLKYAYLPRRPYSEPFGVPFVRIAHAPQGFAGSAAIIPDVASGRRFYARLGSSGPMHAAH